MTDARMDRMIGVLLRTGVLLSAATTLAGGIWHLSQNGSKLPDYHVFRGEPSHLSSLGGVLHGLAQGRSECLIQLGLLMLIATPIARVALSVVAFAAERDRTYVGITLVVLAALIASAAGFHF
jgi:uncharacterized membrane protein